MTFLGDYRGGDPSGHHAPDDEDVHVPALALAGHSNGGHDAHATAHEPETGTRQSEPSPAAAGHHDAGHGEPHESPWIMTLPLLILAVPAVVAGFLNAGVGPFHTWFAELVNGGLPEFAREEIHGGIDWTVAIVSSALAVLGIVSALAVYGFGARVRVGLGPLRPVYALLANRYFLDDLYERVIVGGIFYKGICGLASFIDTRLIDGIVNGAAWVARWVGRGFNRVQSGQEQAYGFVLVGGLVVIAAVMFVVTL
jgi:NADH-quinone oxidoreductase subunit L